MFLTGIIIGILLILIGKAMERDERARRDREERRRRTRR
jgi:hypothetical protein